MRLGPFEIAWRRKTVGNFITNWPYAGGGQPGSGGAWFPVVRESFGGAWQRGITLSVDTAASHPTLWGCQSLIASDISKCCPYLMEEDDEITKRVENPAYSPFLRKPNHYQNRIQFYESWVLSKLSRGNTYVLKGRDNRGVVNAGYVLDPTRTRPLVSPSGQVYYALSQDVLAGVTEASVVVPAREIIHDRWNCLYHPLCGLSPIFACGHPAVQALTIMSNATRLFRRGLLVGGIITTPGNISEADAKKFEQYYEANFSGEENIGKIAVLGGGMKFEKPETMSAVDAQLIEQLKWDDEKICAAYHIPPFMVGVGPLPSYNNVEALSQMYYGQALQNLFEALELCLTEGLEMKSGFEAEFDLSALSRMDSSQQIDVITKAVVGGVMAPNEGRRKLNLPPVKGGADPYLQQQNYSLEALAKRDSVGPPPGTPPLQPAEPPAPKGLDGIDWTECAEILRRRFEAA